MASNFRFAFEPIRTPPGTYRHEADFKRCPCHSGLHRTTRVRRTRERPLKQSAWGGGRRGHGGWLAFFRFRYWHDGRRLPARRRLRSWELPERLLRQQRVLRRSDNRPCMWLAREPMRFLWLGFLQRRDRLRRGSCGLFALELRRVLPSQRDAKCGRRPCFANRGLRSGHVCRRRVRLWRRRLHRVRPE